MSKVSVIVVNHNGKDFIIDCLTALERQLFKDFETILVDNGSSDNSLPATRKFLEKSPLGNHVKLVALDSNTGFTGGNLAGIGHSDAEYIALLNNDAEPDRDWLGNLVGKMEANPDIGICASKLIIPGANIIDSAGDAFATNLKGFKLGEGKSSDGYNEEGCILGASAGAALYRRKMLDEIGFLDEDFFLIHEDTDLNLRAQLAGWKVLYVPTAVAYHRVRATIGPMSDIAVYYTLRNSELVRIKNIPLSLFLRCLPEFILGTIADFFYFAVKHGKMRFFIKAKIDAMRLLPRMLRKRKHIMNNMKVNTKYLYSIMTPVWNREFLAQKLRKFLSI